MHAMNLVACREACYALHLFEDWFNMKPTALWRQQRPHTRAVKGFVSLHALPGGHECVGCPDQMHTWHHGYGREFAASAIAPFMNMSGTCVFVPIHVFDLHVIGNFQVLLACRWRVFGGKTIDDRLENAFDSFTSWRIATKTTTSLTKFELKTFKMDSPLGQ